MHRHAVAGLAGLALAACSGTSRDAGARDGGPGGFDSGVAVHDGLPCDVASLLQNRCDACHGSPALAAPDSIVDYADLVSPAPSDKAKTTAQVSLERMRDVTSPMPPSGLLAAAEVAVLESWINAGEPRSTCDGADRPDAGAPVCTSGLYDTRSFGPGMGPGRSCNECHGQNELDPPIFTIAGTVYPALREPADCVGDTSATVVVTDAKGTTLTLPTSAAGNFTSQQAVVFPIQVKVTRGDQTREMETSPYSGDCNSCHTQDGAQGAPGRVQAP